MCMVHRRLAAAADLWSENYRLQDIQLSKITRGSAPIPGSVARVGPMPRSAPSQARRARLAVTELAVKDRVNSLVGTP
jgi:hypothetical protein